MEDIFSIQEKIKAIEKELADLDSRKASLQESLRQLIELRNALSANQTDPSLPSSPNVSQDSSVEDKLALFRTLFRGREDVFARRFESQRSGKSGYQPECRKQWIRGLCRKPAVKCADCDVRDFTPLSDEIILNHLVGKDRSKRSNKDFTVGVYPLLEDETCWFLAVDFDKEDWKENSLAYLDACRSLELPAVLERSRSGNGGHIWMFFSEPLPARLARQLGAFILTQAMENRPELGFRSYDRFFPSQDTLPKGGFGNLIALPLQKRPRENGNSVFVDESFNPFPDQWALLSSIRRMSSIEVESILDRATGWGGVLGVRYVSTDEDDAAPWLLSPSGRKPEIQLKGPLPDEIELVLGNQIYIAKSALSPALQNRLIRLAAFQNPDFYRAQAMRFPTFGKPRIVHCCEDFPQYIGLPRGCTEDVIDLLQTLGIRIRIDDQRFQGREISAEFRGNLRPDQKLAVDSLLAHDTGVLAASTAFGKTVAAAFLIAGRGVNTLILVHRKQLLDQWIGRINEFLEMAPGTIGQIGSGKRHPTGVIDVAMIQSLNKKGVVDDIVADYGHLVVDECHHISAQSFEAVARQSKAKYVTGLSATVVRKDGHHPIIFMNCGPVRYRMDDKKQAAKRPFDHKVIVRQTEFRLPPSFKREKNDALHQIYAALIEDEKRNRMIVRDVLDSLMKRRFPLVLTERKKHLENLQALLSGKVESIIVMRGGMGKRQKADALEALAGLPDHSDKIILATGKYLGEGFDDERLDTLFLTMPISWRGLLTQYAGRLHRTHHMKSEVVIYDYADLGVPMLGKMYERRLIGYRSIGYTVQH